MNSRAQASQKAFAILLVSLAGHTSHAQQSLSAAELDALAKISVMVGQIPVEARDRRLSIEATDMYGRMEKFFPATQWPTTVQFLKQAAPNLRPEHVGPYFSFYAMENVPITLLIAASERVGKKCNTTADGEAKGCQAAELRATMVEMSRALPAR